MKRLLFYLALAWSPFVALQAQSIHFGVAGGLSIMNSTSDYRFVYEGGFAPWTSKFEEVNAQKPDFGFSISTTVEFRLPNAPISFNAGVSYAQLYGTTESVKARSPMWYNTVYTIGELKTRSNLITIGTGVQWEVFPSDITPYVSFALLYTIFGDMRLTIRSPDNTIDATVEGRTSAGLSIGMGLRTDLSPFVDARLGMTYTRHDLITSDVHAEQRNSFNISAGVLFKVF